MKIQDIPQVGKLGLTVTWPARNALVDLPDGPG
jgi:hypothetical protein